MKYRYIMAVMTLAVALTACTEKVSQNMVWQVQSSEKTGQTGDILSTPAANTDGWIAATVPSTLMGVLTANGIEPEALTAEDYARIDKQRFEKSWWYRTTFDLPALKEGEHVLLDFDGVCYRANVWLNGQQIANSQEMFGSFRQFEYDITNTTVQENVLAVEVFRAQPGEPNIGFADWNPRPADESMGIFREVKIKTCGNVAISHSAVRSKVNAETLNEAWLTVATELKNLSDRPVEGVLQGTADGHTFNCPVTLAAGEKKHFVVPSEIHIDNPRLWWCHNMGKPELCDLHVEFVEDGKVSDAEDVRFGIREVHSYLTEEGFRGYTLNGQKILLRGAGWTDDIYLRDTPETNRRQLELVRNMNLNTVRLEGFWGTSQNLYDLCDELGLLILVGWSCHWEWEDYLGSPCDERYGGINTPEKIDLIAKSFRDQVLWLRYHPSIIGWFVGSDMLPMPELERQYQAFIQEYDDREYIISAKDMTSDISGPSGTKMAGPYEYVGPSYWYDPQAPGGGFGFNTETGIGAQLPVKSSLEKMQRGGACFPMDSHWDIFCTSSSAEMNSLSKLNEVIEARFGKTENLDQYLHRADMLNYESTRAMFETFRVNRPHTTGIIQWMLNGARPGIYWQLYDKYLQPNAAYYAVKKGNEPVQLIYDYHRRQVFAVNETLEPATMKAEMKVVADGKTTISEHMLTVPAGEVIHAFDLPETGAPAIFLFLRAKDGDGKEIAANEYYLVAEKDTYDWGKTTWVTTPITHYASYRQLNDIKNGACLIEAHPTDDPSTYEVTVNNPSDEVVFLLCITAQDATGKELESVLWSDNYLTLAPGETRTVICELPPHSSQPASWGQH